MNHEETKNFGSTVFTSLVTTLESQTVLKTALRKSGGPRKRTPEQFYDAAVYQLQNCYMVTGDGHWIWTGEYQDSRGGRLKGWCAESGFPNARAASCSYIFHKGPVPDNHVVKVTCGEPLCICPDHLEAFSKSQQSQLNALANPDHVLREKSYKQAMKAKK